MTDMSRIILSKISKLPPDDLNKEAASARTEKWVQRIGELQHKLYAEKKQALLVVLQGMDGSGKDGVHMRHAKPECVEASTIARKRRRDLQLSEGAVWSAYAVCGPQALLRRRAEGSAADPLDSTAC